jgi:outer membrane protein OmpA-like peptidoglycan-associated protein
MSSDMNHKFKIGKMRQLLLILISILPFFSMAQTLDTFPENAIITVEKTGVNTVASDFGPEFVGNELWFSAFSDEAIDRLSKGRSKNAFYNLYFVPIDDKGHMQGDKMVKMPDISAGYHAGPVSYCQATGELFITLSNFEDPKINRVVFQKAKVPLKINIFRKSGGSWTDEKELPYNNSSWSIGHPAVSPTGDTLIFASDIPDKGKGKIDLYMIIRSNGEWGRLINLGDKINTPGDEMFPFFHNGKLLFFASNGIAGGKGGLDIYYAHLTPEGFDTPKNLDELNSERDDFGLVIHSGGEVGYFTSQKPGGEGDDDIYKVIFEVEEEGEFELELLVLDKKTGEYLPEVKVNFSDNVSFYTGSDGLIKRKLDKNVVYTATSDLDGYMNESVSFTTINKPYGTLQEVIRIEKVEVGQKFVLENIYYDFDKWDILPESEVELNKLVKVLEDNPSWKVELGSHTDCRGSDAYNEVLSQKRSESAVKYIISKGISQNRITAKGYGETQLVNQCDDGIQCSEEEHRMNRRTEFKILELD